MFPSGLRSGSWILSALLEHLSTAPSTLSVSGKLLSPFEPVQSPTCADRRKCPRKSLQLPLAVPIKNHITHHHIQSTILLNFCYKGGAHTCFIGCITYSCGYEAHMSSTRDWSSVIQCFKWSDATKNKQQTIWDCHMKLLTSHFSLCLSSEHFNLSLRGCESNLLLL